METTGLRPHRDRRISIGAVSVHNQLVYAHTDLLVGFHADFDKMMITRATSSALGIGLQHEWLDLAILAPEILVDLSKGASTLDDWTDPLQITNPERHNAAADALVTAQLLQVTLAAARE